MQGTKHFCSCAILQFWQVLRAWLKPESASLTLASSKEIITFCLYCFGGYFLKLLSFLVLCLSLPTAIPVLSLSLSLESHRLMQLLLPNIYHPYTRTCSIWIDKSRRPYSTRLNPRNYPHGNLFILSSKIISKLHLA